MPQPKAYQVGYVLFQSMNEQTQNQKNEPNISKAEVGVVSLRNEMPEDEAFLFAVYASTREAELAMTGWDEAACTAFLNMQFRAMRVGYRGSFPNAEFSIVLFNGSPVGRLVVDRGVVEVCVVDVALLPASRNQGIGTTLMRHLLAEVESSGKPVRLRVQKGSPANRFYQRLGFKQIEEFDFDVQMEWLPKNNTPVKS